MKFLVTAGPTREYIDPFRFISNPSSGQMGFALATAAHEHGCEVTLISGPVSSSMTIKDVRRIEVISAKDMLEAVKAEFINCDVLIMAAAVSDWKPLIVSKQKLKKEGDNMILELIPTIDILKDVTKKKGRRVVIGFAAETDNLIDYAQAKLENKKLDLVVANDISEPCSGFGVETNQVTIVWPEKVPETWPLLTKREVAKRLIDLAIEIYDEKN